MEEIEANAHTMPEYRSHRSCREAFGHNLHIPRRRKISEQVGAVAWCISKAGALALFSGVMAMGILVMALSVMDMVLDAVEMVLP